MKFEALKVGRWMCARIKAGKRIEPKERYGDDSEGSEGSESEGSGGSEGNDNEGSEGSDSSTAPTAAESAEAGEERQAADQAAAAAAKQALAAAITEYVADRQADTAQEDRWRTTMQRRMDQGFRELRKEIEETLVKKIGDMLDEKLGKQGSTSTPEKQEGALGTQLQEEVKKIYQAIGELQRLQFQPWPPLPPRPSRLPPQGSF